MASATEAEVGGGDDVLRKRDCRLLVERIAASRVVSKSARLRDLLVYVCERVLEDGVGQIHEQEVGHRVFARPPDYDTTVDNIVRVHASLLRKRLAEYFSKEGAQEPIVIEIPKGNYAPAFRARAVVAPSAAAVGGRAIGWPVWTLAALAMFFAGTTATLLLRDRPRASGAKGKPPSPTVHLLWSQVFRPNRSTDVVLDDATIGLYQELTKRPIALHDYYDRSYLRRLPESAEAAGLDRDAAASVVIRRHSSYAAVAPLPTLLQLARSEESQATVQFARDYSFRDLKTNNVILLGSSQSNPWFEPFQSHLGLRWVYDRELESSYPVDTWDGDAGRARFRPAGQAGEGREGYCAVALLSNLGANGDVLLVSATGGSAIAACADFLTDEGAVAALRARLAGAGEKGFPYFETLLRASRGTPPSDLSIVLCRPPRN